MRIHDWRVGGLYWGLMFCIFLYIVGYEMLYEEGYRAMAVAQGFTRQGLDLSFNASTARYCLRNNEQPGATLPDGTMRFPCVFLDDMEMVSTCVAMAHASCMRYNSIGAVQMHESDRTVTGGTLSRQYSHSQPVANSCCNTRALLLHPSTHNTHISNPETINCNCSKSRTTLTICTDFALPLGRSTF